MKRIKVIIFFLVWALLSIPAADGGQTELRILYVNDFHGFAEPHQPVGAVEPLGGVAYLAGKVDRLRRGRPTLLLAGGDMTQGNNWANFFKGASSIELMNAMKFDALVVGNHEFDYGVGVLKKRISQARFPVLGANVQGLSAVKPYVIKKFPGLRVAIIGVVTQDTPVTTHPRNVVGLKFLNPDDTVAGYLEKLKNQADIFIVLTHLGHPVDRMMAVKVKGIDVIVGGHSHTKVMKPAVAGNTLVVQAWEHAKALGVLDLTIQDRKIVKYDGYLEEIKPVPGGENPAVQKIVAKYEGQLDRLVNVAIGEAEVDLDGQHVRTRETNLGNLITDIIRETTGATAAIINGGGIRTGIPKGVVKIKDVYTALPFDNYLVSLRLTGREIREALEHGVSSLGEPAGRFPQVSGLRFTYSLSAPAGSRVREVIIGGGPLDPVKEYAVATHDFLIAGGDGYKVFSRAINTDNHGHLGGLLKSDRIIYNDASRWLRDVVIQYIQTNKKITARVEGRIQEIL